MRLFYLFTGMLIFVSANSGVSRAVSTQQILAVDDSRHFSFNDALPPEVIGTVPIDGEEDAYRDTTISITIVDQGIVGQPAASGVDPDSIIVTVNGTQEPVTLVPYHDAGYVAVYMPEEPFAASSQVSVATVACDNAGNCMMPFEFSFGVSDNTADHTPPYAVDPSPPNGAETGNYLIPIEVTLSDWNSNAGDDESMYGVDPVSINMQVNGVSVTFQIEQVFLFRYLVRYEHSDPFPADSLVAIDLDAADLAGNRMSTYRWSFHTRSASDRGAPAFAEMFPRFDAVAVSPLVPIRCTITDADGDIDTSSIALLINGRSVSGDLNLNAVDHGYQVSFRPLLSLSANSTISISLAVGDLSENSAVMNWQFTTGDNSHTPFIVAPYNDSWLDYNQLQGHAVLAWQTVPTAAAFRFRFYLYGQSTPTDLDVDANACTNSRGFFSIDFSIDRVSWDSAATVGNLWWQVAELSAVGSAEVSDYSDPQFFTLGSSTAVGLLTPIDFINIRNSQPTTMSWTPEAGAISYVLGLVRLDAYGNFTNDVFTVEIPADQTSLDVATSSWSMIAAGDWLWTTVGITADGGYSNYILHHFNKD